MLWCWTPLTQSNAAEPGAARLSVKVRTLYIMQNLCTTAWSTQLHGAAGQRRGTEIMVFNPDWLIFFFFILFKLNKNNVFIVSKYQIMGCTIFSISNDLNNFFMILI